MDAVPVVCLLDGADIQVQGPQNLGQLQAQLPKRVWDVFRLRHPVLASALFACFGCHFGPCNTTCVHRFQRPWLQRMALFANGPGAKLAPLPYKRSLARRCYPRQPSIVGCNVLCLGLREVVVHKKLLLHPVPVGLAALLVGRDFFAANIFESSLSALQSCLPLLCRRLCMLRHWRLSFGQAPFLFQSLCVKFLSPLVWNTQDRCVVDVAVLVILCPESFQSLGDI